MSECRAAYIAVQVTEQAPAVDDGERQFLLTQLNGLIMQAAALADQRAAVMSQAAAIRKRLGLEEKRNTR